MLGLKTYVCQHYLAWNPNSLQQGELCGQENWSTNWVCTNGNWSFSKLWAPDSPAKQTPQQDPSATRLLGEHWLRRQKTPSPRTGAVYIGLGVTCPHLIGCAFSTSFTCLQSGSDSAKNSMAHAHIGCLPIFMGIGLLKPAPFCNGVCGFPQQCPPPSSPPLFPPSLLTTVPYLTRRDHILTRCPLAGLEVSTD